MYHTWMRYFTPRPVHHRLGLVCLGVGLQHGALPPVGPRTLDHHVAVVISAGGGWYRGPDDRRHTVTAPALLWLTPGTRHHYAPDPSWDEAFVDFTGPATAGYTELGYIDPGHPLVPLTDTAAARTAIRRIARAARPGNPYLEVETAAAVHELLVALRRARADTGGDGHPVLRALARDAFLPLTVAEHAARHGMTPAELRAVVRRATGRGPKEHLLDLRLARAKDLLAGTELPVAAVARRVGYDDPAYFSRLFARRVGTAPVRYREQQARTVPGGFTDRVPDPHRPPLVAPAAPGPDRPATAPGPAGGARTAPGPSGMQTDPPAGGPVT
ncbi:helix-turn-helix transcriptional regulator [Streptomyces pactum]|uniref:helix-turn-helix transcriptional regulator n=1 Tax=Streptomyces pactum TaxID=68249 RepID=UPI0036FCF359